MRVDLASQMPLRLISEKSTEGFVWGSVGSIWEKQVRCDKRRWTLALLHCLPLTKALLSPQPRGSAVGQGDVCCLEEPGCRGQSRWVPRVPIPWDCTPRLWELCRCFGCFCCAPRLSRGLALILSSRQPGEEAVTSSPGLG